MGELWDELADARKEKQLLAEAVAEIKGLCSKEHNKNHFGECPECWPRLINRVRDRYLNPSTKAWFSGRRLFLQELDTLFTQALEQDPINLAQIEKRIEDEKKEWYRDKLKNLGLVSAARTPAEAQALQQILDDRNIPVPQVATNLRGALGDIANESGEAFDMFMDRLKGAKSQEEKTEVYVDMFFQPQRDPEGAAKSQKYIEMLRGGRSLSDVISAVLRDRQTNNGVQDQKDSLREKISELERAKAAHEAGKAKKAKIKQDKANAAAAARPLLNLPPCAVCGNAIDEQNFQPCFTCITLSEVYHVLGHPPAVFCSNECIERGFVGALKLRSPMSSLSLTQTRSHMTWKRMSVPREKAAFDFKMTRTRLWTRRTLQSASARSVSLTTRSSLPSAAYSVSTPTSNATGRRYTFLRGTALVR